MFHDSFFAERRSQPGASLTRRPYPWAVRLQESADRVQVQRRGRSRIVGQLLVVEEYCRPGLRKIRVARGRSPHGIFRVAGEPLHGCRLSFGVACGQGPDLGVLVVGEGSHSVGREVRPGGEVAALGAGVLEEAAQQKWRGGVWMVLSRQDAYAEVVVGGQACDQVRWQQVVPGSLPAQQWVVGECVSADGLGIPGHLGRRVEDEGMVHGDLVVDLGPFLLASAGLRDAASRTSGWGSVMRVRRSAGPRSARYATCVRTSGSGSATSARHSAGPRSARCAIRPRVSGSESAARRTTASGGRVGLTAIIALSSLPAGLARTPSTTALVRQLPAGRFFRRPLPFAALRCVRCAGPRRTPWRGPAPAVTGVRLSGTPARRASRPARTGRCC